MGIKQHNGNTKADRLAELKIRSPSIQLIKFGAIGLNAIIFSPLLIAADTGSQYGTNITINDGDRITGDTADPSGNLYGVMTPAGNTPGNINLGNDVTVNVNDASGYAKGIIIQGKNSSLTANRLTVDVVGQTSAIGINLIGDYTHADLGTGSTIKSNDDGIIIGHSSTLTATQFTIENSNGIGLTINDYGTSVDLGSGSKITTDGSTGVYIGGLNGNNANGAARFTATDLTIDVQGYSAMGINVQKNSVVDLGTNSTIKTNGDNAHGLWSFGQVSANALTVDVTGAAANGVEVRGGTTTIGADSHISSAQGGGLVTSGSDAIINFTGTAAQRNSIFSGGSYGASAQTATAVVNMQNTDITVDRNGSLALGLWALSGGRITGDSLAITGAAGARGIYAMTNSQIDLTSDLVIDMSTPDQMAIATLLPLIFNKSPLLLTPLPSPTTSARIIKVLLPLRFSTFNVANVPAVDPWLAKSTVEWLSASVSRLELLVTFQTLLFIATSSFPPLTLSLREEPVQTDPGCISRLISPPLERTLPLISIRPEALMRLAA